MDSSNGQRRIAFVLRRDDERTHELATVVEERLVAEGYQVTLDSAKAEASLEGAAEVGARLRESNVVCAFLSQGAAFDEEFDQNVETAREAARSQAGRPAVFVIRVGYSGPALENVSASESLRPALVWENEASTESLVGDLLGALKDLFTVKAVVDTTPRKGLRLMPVADKEPRKWIPPAELVPSAGLAPIPSELEHVGGASPLHSEFYMERGADAEMRDAIAKNDSIVLVKGPRQIGKTSLLARGLQNARERGAKVALTDFQKFNASNLNDIVSFFISLGESLADQLDLDVFPTDVWDDRRGPSVNFERYVRKEVLAGMTSHLAWGLDEVDRLFGCPYGSEVFGLFRSWHNERALDPSGPWAGLTLCIAYATEAHLFISDMNQSPFNVGTRLELEDFDREAIVELNRRHKDPLESDAHIDRFYALVGGHPFLVRKGLHEMVSKKIGIGEFELSAPSSDGIFGDHLRRILFLLGRDPALRDALRAILREGCCEDSDDFYRLRTAGLVVGPSKNDVRLRCHLYDTYLSERLL